ncbi:unnamed protein product [Polarella glacialis]|uniref:Mitochondrial carrier protein n=1 Tax=Polarella glacialis TaxID=89957 RepID=A0A813DM55_POLGL|nr:unnamed protein product [Polarella glacialis]
MGSAAREAAIVAGAVSCLVAATAARPVPVDSQGQRSTLGRDCLASGAANAVVSAALNPLDISKTRMQVEVRSAGSLPKYSSVPGALRALYAEGGLCGLWLPGLGVSMLREMVGGSIRGGVYVSARDYLCADKANSSLVNKAAAACFAGSIGGVLSNPIEIVKIRLLADSRSYPSALRAFAGLGEPEGFLRGCSRGMATSVTRAAVVNAGYLATYDHAKHSLVSSLGGQDGPLFHVAASLISGLVTTTVAAPFDMLKTRVMASSEVSVLQILKSAIAAEGASSLFRGWFPAYLRIGPHSLLCFPLLEEIRRILGLSYI